MASKLFSKQAWTEALKQLRDTYRIFIPVNNGDFHYFTLLEDETIPDFDFKNTRLSPKSIVYPQSERMFECSVDSEDPEVNILKEVPKNYPSQAIVGIRHCDVHAFQIVKRNFDSSVYRDPWWVQHFESTIFVGFGCNDPCSTCFCTAVGGGPYHEEGLDLLVYDMEDRFLAKPLTEKGREFLDKTHMGNPAKKAALKEAEDLKAAATKKMHADIPVNRLHKQDGNDLFNAPFWVDVAFACINCGICTYLCPTCWCFDIQDEVFAKQADRMRNWDSCMFPLFTLHGSGHNPREKKYQRVRQRFMHKLKYYVDKYNNGVQCSGCGRCVQHCPVNIDIRKIVALMNDFKKQ